ncbi:Bifunctional inhibitor/plant lipid transfer protein/seed storage helical domain [Melia azedarach]|uniref:Bifunctional inhibitor/plant lipid transfer protein/seed storage helical domain n=1 Tax=Melia azedarach TaxID=155640 RepID=A0ACC1XMS1_MELAZ|nr:Bifunctional inhibitor/plant lipid transfer protein/seed storage helical domain [Melia azedarach]
MRKSSSTLVVVLVVVAFVGVKMGCAELSAAECKEERKIGLDECKPVLYGKLPTPACCQRVRASHVECVCPDVTPWVVALIDVNRAIRLIEGCGRRVPRHFKCGWNCWIANRIWNTLHKASALLFNMTLS